MNRRNRDRKLMPLPSLGKDRGTHQMLKNEKILISPEDEKLIQDLVSQNPDIFPANQERIDPRMDMSFLDGSGLESKPVREAWIQTYSGRRFNPLAPVEGAIVIQDIAHSLSMLCRFTGHCRRFYSVAQHSVLVSYLCDSKDAMHGLLHDASEAYLQDLPRPLKRSGKFDAYKEYEHTLQTMIFKRFELDLIEPESVKKADTLLLATEARDLMSPLHSDWKQPVEPLPMKIEPLNPAEAKDLFMKRFFELRGCPDQFEHYLRYDAIR